MTTETGKWTVECYVPSLVSRRRQFRRAGANDPLLWPGQLYVTADEMNDQLRGRAQWPPEARVITERVALRGQPEGTTYRNGDEREVVHGERIKFVLSSPALPPGVSWRPWTLKKVAELVES